MARGKKKESALTPEEKLAQALIPEGEQPYRVPENWCWTTLKNVSNIVMGQSPAGTDTTDDPSYIPLIGGAADMGALYPKATRYTKVPTKISHAEDIILCIRATLGRPIYSDGEYCLGRGVAAIRSTILSKEFLRFFFIDQEQYLYDNATGTTFAQINSDTLSQMPIALPPLAEQQRIVDRIESLFAKLDEAKEKAQSVLDSFETRKAAILHKAFTGELTSKWRAECGRSVNTWKNAPLTDIATVVSGYAFSSKDFHEENTVPCIKITNVGVGEYIADDYEYLPSNYLEEYGRFAVKKGDILISLTRSYINAGLKVCICEEGRASLLNQRVALIKNCNTGYIFYYLRSDDVLRYVKEKSKTTNQPNLSIKDLNSMLIAVPCADEQNEIVRILDSLLAKEQQAKEASEAVLEKIDLLKKSILARAFRGELGTNDPNEESAVELLMQVL